MRDKIEIEQLCHNLLLGIGEDPSREGLVKTPARFATAIQELTSGYNQTAEEIVNGALFEHERPEMVLVKDVEFYSLCEHHLLPFFGRVNVAYIPNGKIIGLSKIPRIINMYARRLQVQERLTQQIADELNSLLKPKGVACMVEGFHMCMMMRGIQVQSSKVVTSSMTGYFLKSAATRAEFLSMLKS